MPFEIELSGGWKCVIRHPELIIMSNGSVVLFDEHNTPHFFETRDVVRVGKASRRKKK